MELNLTNQRFIVGGASSGFGNAVARLLLAEGAHVLAIARGEEKLKELQSAYPTQVEIIAADISQPQTIALIQQHIGNRQVHGMLVNAGGPPAMTVMETKMEDWDSAYRLLLRWKVELIKTILPEMITNGYGRVVCIESASVKEPIENLVLSNSLRLAVIGFLKTLSNETAAKGITINALAPGFHATAAIDRLVKKKSEQTGKEEQAVREEYVRSSRVGKLGAPEDFAALACWLLSPASRFITGQTISVDGGSIRGVMG